MNDFYGVHTIDAQLDLAPDLIKGRVTVVLTSCQQGQRFQHDVAGGREAPGRHALAHECVQSLWQSDGQG